MGTKNNPSEFDCYANALPDEPMFHLLARDPAAPELIRIWVAVKNNDFQAAKRFLEYMFGLQANRTKFEEFGPQHQEAYKVAAEMDDWRKANYGKWRDQDGDNS